VSRYVRKREWELFENSDGTVDIYHDGRIFHYGAEDLEEAVARIKRSRIPWSNPTFQSRDGWTGPLSKVRQG
jgi:ArsR family metal-binding transcriptional regulator